MSSSAMPWMECDRPEVHRGHPWLNQHSFGSPTTMACPGRLEDARQPGYTPHQERVRAILQGALDTFSERSLVYRDNYAIVGRVMTALFPDGTAPKLRTEEDFNRWHIFELAIVKLTRYAVNYASGHKDSLDDMQVYLAILGALDQEMLAQRDVVEREWRRGLGRRMEEDHEAKMYAEDDEEDPPHIHEWKHEQGSNSEACDCGKSRMRA